MTQMSVVRGADSCAVGGLAALTGALLVGSQRELTI
jgi:hypothetical protein